MSVTNLITGDGNNLTKLLMIDHIPPQGTQIYGSPANISRGLGENNPKDTGKVVATDGDQINNSRSSLRVKHPKLDRLNISSTNCKTCPRFGDSVGWIKVQFLSFVKIYLT